MSVRSATKETDKIESIRQGLECMRSTKRRTVVWPAVLYVNDFEFRATMYDISLGGIRLKISLPLATGAEVSVKIKNKITMKARVVWYAGEFLGLQFCDSPDDVRKSLGDMSSGLD